MELIERLARNEPIYRRWPHVPVRFFAPVPDPSNPWTGSTGPPKQLDPTIYRAMVAGTLNPWLKEQSGGDSQNARAGLQPGRNTHALPAAHAPILQRGRCQASLWPTSRSAGPSTQGTHRHWSSWGCDPETAEVLSRDPIYRRQNQHLAQLCAALRLPSGRCDRGPRAGGSGRHTPVLELRHPPPPSRLRHDCSTNPRHLRVSQ